MATIVQNYQPIAARPPEAQEAPSGKRPRVLVVDDNIDAANSLGRLLSLLGREVAVAHGGESAVMEAARFRPHLVFLDIGMPGIDGIEAAERIRKLEGGHRIVIVALTGWGQERDRERTQAAGFAHHLVKPVHVDQLEGLLARIDGLPG